MRHYFSGINWGEKITEDMDVDSTWHTINNEITYARETFIPTLKLNNKVVKRKLNCDDIFFVFITIYLKLHIEL